MTKPQTYDHLKSRKKPIQRSIWLALDPDLAEENAELTTKTASLRIRHLARPTDEKLTAELAEAEEALERSTAELRDGNAMKFLFRSIGRRRYDDLIDEHQPTKDQIKELQEINPQAELEFNPETFPQALIAASIVSPELTKSEVADMFQSEDWSGAELSALFETALLANTTRRIIDLGNGSRGTNGSS